MSQEVPHTPFAIITGASRGIGAEYARALATRGYSLLLIARDENRLKDLARTITSTHTVEIKTECIDLAKQGAAQQVYEAATLHNARVDLLINNAGFGLFGEFATMPMHQIQAMLQLHINTVVETTRLFLPSMLEKKSGGIINVASIAGFLAIPYMAEYAATKAFLVSFSEAVAKEVRSSGVTIQACCPGSTETDFHRTAGHQPRNPLPAQTAQEVVHASLKALKTRKSRVTVGLQGFITETLTRFMPQSILMKVAGKRAKPS